MPVESVRRDFKTQEPRQSLADDRAAVRQGMRRGIVVDGLDNVRLFGREHGADGNTIRMPSRGIACPFLQGRQFLLDFNLGARGVALSPRLSRPG